MICPRCGNTEFSERECGPDTYDADITYTSWICTQCGLWYSGWTGQWLIDCESWRDEQDCEEYIPDELLSPEDLEARRKGLALVELLSHDEGFLRELDEARAEIEAGHVIRFDESGWHDETP